MSLEPRWSTTTTRLRTNGDRLSSLPDCLLVDIISFLPPTTAASTSVLSRRWRSLWTQTTSFVFDVYHGPGPSIRGSVAEIFTLVSHIIGKLSAPKLTRFELELPSLPEDDYQRSLVNSWIRSVCAKNVEELEVGFKSFIGPRQSENVVLPPYIFQCKSLVSLSLTRGFDYELPVDGIFDINLPNLKKLDIWLFDSRRELLATLFKSCPLLEYLKLMVNLSSDKRDNYCVNISGQNLKELIIYHWHCSYQRGNEFLINAPNLRHISLEGSCYSYHRFVEHPSGLAEADFHIVADMEDDGFDQHGQMLEMVQGICSASTLTVNIDGFNFFGYWGRCNMPVCFNNLTKFWTDYDDSIRWSDLLLFLHCVPSLQVLGFNYMGHDDSAMNWEAFEGTARCLSTSVRRIRIQSLEGTKTNWHFLAYLLRLSSVLEQLAVDVCNGKDLNHEFELCRDLFLYPRSSATSEIQLAGRYLNASSKSFEHGSIDSVTYYTSDYPYGSPSSL